MSTYLVSILVQAIVTALIVGLTVSFIYVAQRYSSRSGRAIIDLYLCQQQARAYQAELSYLHELIVKQLPELYSRRAVLEARRVSLQALINVIDTQITAQGGGLQAPAVLIVSRQTAAAEMRRIEADLDVTDSTS